MSQIVYQNQPDLSLPISVVSVLDLRRLVSELERADGEMTAMVMRQKAGAVSNPTDRPIFSEQLTSFLGINQINFADSDDRTRLVGRLRKLKDSAPVVHLTFATSADQETLEQIVQWLRQSIDQRIVIAVGLQPGLIGGVYMRTTNQIRDLSVRAQLAGHRKLIVEKLETLNGV